MGGRPKPNRFLSGALLCTLVWYSSALGQTVRHHQVQLNSDAVSEPVAKAENAIGNKDYATAETLLLGAVSNPADGYRAWFDLGEVYRLTGRTKESVDAYKKAIAANPDLYEADLNLGLLLLRDTQDADAAKYLQNAVNRMPDSANAEFKSSAWFAFGRALEPSDIVAAIAAYRKASGFNQQAIEPHLKAAKLLASQHEVEAAAAEYHAVSALSPRQKDALTGLVDLYRENGRPAQAESALRNYAKEFPDDPRVHLMLGQSLLKSGNVDGAMNEFDAGLRQDPTNVGLLHEIAAMYAAQKKFDQAAPRYDEVVKAAPDNADYHYQYGVVLMQLHKFPEAQQQLIAALQRDAGIKEAYGELAIAASENKQYPLVIKVLDARGKLEPETPATFFLRATAYDNLKAYPQAVENYHKFLDASNGQSPENEWKARHRLIAIEPEGGSKKKK